MHMEIMFTVVIAVVLYGLINTTENFLARRAKRVEKDVRMLDHRSRM